MTSESAALSSLIGDIYDAAMAPDRWQAVLARTCDFVGGSSAVLFWHDALNERSAALHMYNDDPHYSQLYFEKYLKMNPVFPAAAFLETGIVYAATDIIPQAELVKTRFYREWLAPQRMVGALAAILEKGVTRAALLNIRWLDTDQVMDDDARRRLALVIPHYQRAVSIGRLFDQSRATEDSLTETLDHVEAGVFLVGRKGQIVFTNEAGHRLLRERTILRESQKVLTAAVKEADRTLQDSFLAAEIGDGTVGNKGVAVSLSPQSGEHWFAHVLPLTSGTRRQTGSIYSAIAAVFVRKAMPETPSPLETLAKRYQLTASEVRVLDAVMQVNGVKAIADLLGISQATVKTHLQHVYRKTSAHRQSDLVKLVAGIGGTAR